MPQKQQYYDLEETAKELNISRRTVFNLIGRGVLRKFKRPGDKKLYVPAEDINKAKQFEEE